jgi:hypothetical protein
MDWGELGKKIAGIGAPLLGGAIGGPGGAAIGSMVAEAFGLSTDDPTEIARAIDRDPEAAVKLQKVQSDERVRLREIASRQAIAEIEAETEQHRTVNETMRAELKGDSGYRAGWRPAFGYIMAFNMAVISLAFAAGIGAIIWEPANGKNISEGFSAMLGSFVTIFSIGLGVLGVQVHKRSKDKELASGIQKPGVLQRLGKAIQGVGDSSK